MHNKKRFQKRYAKTELRTRGIDICRLCHDGIHSLLTAKELAESYPTTESATRAPSDSPNILLG